MKRVYTTANGRQINLDAVISQNDSTIAVGNMKVNARGDQLGPGGKVEVKKEKIISEYYKLNTPTAVDVLPVSQQVIRQKDLVDDWMEPELTPEQSVGEEAVEDPQPKLRGRLADSVSQAKMPEKESPKKSGPSRI